MAQDDTDTVRRKLLVIGGGGHGRVVAEAAQLSEAFDEIVVVDPHAAVTWSFPLCCCVADEAEIGAEPTGWLFMPAIGAAAQRRFVFEQYRARGFDAAVVRHPRATVSPTAEIGAGTVLCAGAVVGAQAQLGVGVIVNHNAVVEHDCVVGDFAHLAPGSVLAGAASLGRDSFLGAGSTVRHGVRLGDGLIVGNGAAVVSDLHAPGVYVGQPARKLK
jgi:sugar O-acyltransferase (sialic acid O-acetyltransferase NeuD family)